MYSQIVRQFDENGLGGTSRGVIWDYYKPWYYRVTDNTDVDIFGQTPRIRPSRYGHTGDNIPAKLRDNKKEYDRRYQIGDKLLQFTGRLKNALVSDMQIDGNIITLITPVKYAAKQNDSRPFNFFTDEDASVIGEMAVDEVVKRVEE